MDPNISGTSRSGCNPAEYDWCFTNQATWPTIFIPVIVGVMGVGLPMSQISLDTIYSRILGRIDQTILQGFIVVAEDIVLVLGPLYSSYVVMRTPLI
jgi:fumarate reductase subunit D